jgi:serine/threonine-protein kinase
MRVLDGRYRLESVLGRGGVGTVYRARDLRLERAVAVKVLGRELLADAGARERFRRESDILARLRHPGLVAGIDSGTLPDGGAYLVMELVPGEDLRHVLKREGRLDLPAALPILTSVCAAVEAAHRQGVIHGDLKPENIILPDDGTCARVLDFGVMPVLADRAHGSAFFGTPAYMSPEQLGGHPPDARSDVFALGVLTCEMLTGTLPFGGGQAAEVILAQAHGVPAVLQELQPPLARAVGSALERNPDRRPPSAQAFAHLVGAAGVL